MKCVIPQQVQLSMVGTWHVSQGISLLPIRKHLCVKGDFSRLYIILSKLVVWGK